MSRSSPSPRVDLVHEGWLVRRGAQVVGASSSVTLVVSDKAKMLVDTGSRDDEGAVLEGLKAVSVRPEHVTHVVNTHLHVDHCGCNDLFADAVFYAHESEDPPLGTLRVRDEALLAPGVRLIPTPGHTPGSLSVFVESGRRYALCGDAIPTKANYDAHAPPALHFDRQLALRSMDMILGWADVVVPGHGSPFDVVGKK